MINSMAFLHSLPSLACIWRAFGMHLAGTLHGVKPYSGGGAMCCVNSKYQDCLCCGYQEADKGVYLIAHFIGTAVVLFRCLH